jgi:flagellar basal body-associated protein FliL
MIKSKRGMSAWIWILMILIIVAVGIGVYFLLTSGNGSSIISGGNSIPQPPALPSG